MSTNSDSYDIFDPTGMGKSFRDASLDAWAKMMVELVNTEAYAQANGAMLDAWLAGSGPFRKSMESAMTQTLTNLNLPSADDIARLSDRLTNIEMRLDDLDAKLDETVRSPSKTSTGKKTRSSSGGDKT